MKENKISVNSLLAIIIVLLFVLIVSLNKDLGIKKTRIDCNEKAVIVTKGQQTKFYDLLYKYCMRSEGFSE